MQIEIPWALEPTNVSFNWFGTTIFFSSREKVGICFWKKGSGKLVCPFPEVEAGKDPTLRLKIPTLWEGLKELVFHRVTLPRNLLRLGVKGKPWRYELLLVDILDTIPEGEERNIQEDFKPPSSQSEIMIIFGPGGIIIVETDA